jgi:putative Ca2+/H+ antiporter (TMEM165/GDT1 family)
LQASLFLAVKIQCLPTFTAPENALFASQPFPCCLNSIFTHLYATRKTLCLQASLFLAVKIQSLPTSTPPEKRSVCKPAFSLLSNFKFYPPPHH